MKKAIVCFLSYSGNTKEVAELITKELSNSFNVDMYDIARDGYASFPNLASYDVVFMGSFTWGEGVTPDEMKDFIADVGFKPNNIHIFGTGDTQFGEKYYCGAVDRIAKFYNSKTEPLKIEQSPRGFSADKLSMQEKKIIDWVDGIKSIYNSEGF